MFKKSSVAILPFVLLILLLTACSEQNGDATATALSIDSRETLVAAAPTFTNTPTSTALPTATAIQTATVPAPTNTPLPPTTTPVPTPLPAPQVDPEIAAWLQANVIPLDTAVPSDNYQDLMPLKEIIGDARIVSLGESTHGTSEFFQMKDRMIRFLVQEMDFNVVAFEASWPPTQAVNGYIQTGTGTAEEAVATMGFWTWNTSEVADMVRWLREYNSNLDPAEQVQFAGFDMQLYEPAFDQITNYLEQVDPDARAEVLPNLQCFRQLNLYLERTPEEKETCQENLQNAYDFLTAQETAYTAQSSPTEFANGLQSVRILQQAAAYLAASISKSYVLRDQFMAENVGWLLEQAGPDAKIILWAHNVHIDETPGSGVMGDLLQQQFGEDIVSVGLLTHRGTVNAKDRLSRFYQFTAVPAPAQTLEDDLRSSGQSQFLLDLRAAPEGSPAANWLNSSQTHRSIASLYDLNCPQASFVASVPAQQYDVLVYLEETTATQLLSHQTAVTEVPAAAEISFEPVDLAFEAEGICWTPKQTASGDYVVNFPANEGPDGTAALSIRSRGTTQDDSEIKINQWLPATAYRGQQVRLTGMFKTSDVTGGAGLFLGTAFGVGGDDFYMAEDALAAGDTDWVELEFLVEVPSDAAGIVFGPLLTGKGEVWIDNLTLTIVEP